MNASKVLELIWLFLAVLCLVMGVYAWYSSGLEKSYMFFILSALAVFMAYLRRYRRNKLETNSNK